MFLYSRYLEVRKLAVETKAKISAVRTGARLAPGRLSIPASGEKFRQTQLLELSQKLGPIFKVWLPHKFTTCIVGHSTARRFLSENDGKIRAGTPDLSPLFPHGFLRALEGTTHRQYRRQILDAFNNTPLDLHVPEIRQIFAAGILALTSVRQPVNKETIRKSMKTMSTAVFIRIVFGVSQDSKRYTEFVEAYDSYAPDGPFLVVHAHHKTSFLIIRKLVMETAEEIKKNENAVPSLLRHLVRSDTLDDTTLGNLIQMVEASRYDLHGLWCWILKHLGDNPKAIEIARSFKTGSNGNCSAMAAIAHESLRLEQSELVLRVANENLIFDGFFIPKGTHIRICVWEAHHDPQKFPQPFEHNCQRFIESKVPTDSYAPFGLDKHRCLGADWTYFLSELLVEELVREYDWTVTSDGTPEFGKFHFEPSSSLAIQFSKRRENTLSI